ncbi:ATP-dependent nuclease subunit B [Erysipelothrix sp. HDW6C]|uniref:PD-(D/E)XK nuclease family protein n=1 Tax=Erysipelothrix sp. HDW6C TaxID=2714930 RepID=UPI00140B3B1A|nr:PD-(D/E)XK nuclease family protein [Erysipelothrix sp. HDW6C]QIK69025.1 ATP-dependent nuclease subunit B [Erysipelothrix sp. HDW6C]
MRKTYITTSSLIDEFKQTLLQGNSYVMGTSVRNFDFTFNEAILDQNALEVTCFNMLQTLQFDKIAAVLKFPKTIQSLIALIKELDCYGISLSALPQKTPLQQEIALALESIRPLIPAPQLKRSVQYQAVAAGLSYHHTFFLKRHDVPFIIQHTSKPSSIRFKVALNIRSEIEAVAQDLLTHKITDAVIAVPNLTARKPLIESVFARYDLNLVLQDRTTTMVKSQYLSIINVAQKRSISAIITLIEANPLGLRYIDDLVYYIRHFEIDNTTILEPFYYAHEIQGYEEIYRVRERIADDVAVLQAFLENLLSLSYQDVIAFAYDTLYENSTNDLSKIKAFLESNYHLYAESTHEFFLAHFDTIGTDIKSNGTIRVVDIKNLPLTPPDHLYVLDLSAKNFPAIPSRTGILDESYVGAIAGFPSLDVRTQHDLDNQARIFNHATHLTLSYNAATYEGKSHEVSYPVAQFCDENNISLSSWNLIQVHDREISTRHLDPKIASQVYLRDGAIVGSISSFQMYLQDPYNFFIERALGLREPEKFTFDARIIGTINHALMEATHNITNQDPWTNIAAVFPKDSNRIAMIKRRNDALMELNIPLILESIANTDFQVHALEERFSTHDLFEAVHLRGIIDRIDMNDSHLLVVDYKSSALSLSQPAVKAGEQLQLLTYAMIAERRYNKPVLGVFYFGFRNRNINTNYAKYSFAQGIVVDDSDYEVLWMKDKKYSGWMFDRPGDHFDTDTFYGGLRMTKAGMSLWKREFDMNKVRPLLTSIYKDLSTNILNGILDKDAIIINSDPTLDLRKEDEDK